MNPHFVCLILTAITSSLLVTRTSALAGSWLPPETVAIEASSQSFQHPITTVSDDGTVVNVFWVASVRGLNAIVWCRNVSGAWTRPDTIYSTAQSVLKLNCAVSESGDLWVAWHTHVGDDLRAINTIHRENGHWSEVLPISQPPGRRNWNPKLGAGAGKVWIAWYSEVSGGSGQSDIYVEQWNGAAWGEYAQLTVNMPGYHWFVDLKLDDEGRPHLVWGESIERVYYYTKLTVDDVWSMPFVLNPLELGVAAAEWPGCSIALDLKQRPHVGWTGSRVGRLGQPADWDIYYSGFDGTYWSNPNQVNLDDETTDAYPAITLPDDSTVWITWMDGNPAALTSSHVGAATRNLTESAGPWTTWTVDDGPFFYNAGSRVISTSGNRIWVIWKSDHPLESPEPGAIMSRIYGNEDVPVFLYDLAAVGLQSSVELEWKAEPESFLEFRIERELGVNWLTIASIAAVTRDYRWIDHGLAAGSYRYRLVGLTRQGEAITLGSIDVEVGRPPDRLTVRVRSERAEDFTLTIGLNTASNLVLTLFDLQGRSVQTSELGPFAAGWQDIEWSPGQESGRSVANGVYWLRVSAGRDAEAVRIVLSR